MRARALQWLVVLALAAPMPLPAQDISQRPKPRPATEVAAEPAMVKPLPRPASISAAAKTPAAMPAASAEVSPITATTPRPKARPAPQAASAAPSVQGGITSSPFPAPRPKALVEAVAEASAAPAAAEPSAASPETRRPNLIQRLFAAASAPNPQSGSSTQPRRGSVCGDRSIRGEKIAPITSKVKGCGVAEPVRVTEVAGIKLSQAVTVECGTVVALKDWIDQAMRPAFGKREVVQLRIAAHYACRGRNNKSGARISEHGKGKALDISGFIFADGTEWTIRRDYNKQIRKAHKGACGIFGTTLGPGSDGYHEDHLHFDTARYRSAPYCR